MLRLLFILMPSLLIACSKDKPAPVAPAGKAVATVDAPAEPTNLRVEAITDTSARVRWDAVEGATDYDVNYRKAVGGKWTNEPHKGTRLYNTIYDLEPNTEYRWAVRAENSDGPSDWVFGENFTMLDAGWDIQGDNVEAETEPDTAEIELFRDACLEIQAGLEHLLPIALKMRYGWQTVEGTLGYAELSESSILFSGYSASGRFKMSGEIRTGRYDGESNRFPPRGRVWINEVGSDHRGFFIGTKHTIEVNRRGRLVGFKSGEFIEMGKEFLVAIKDDLIETLKLALDTSRNSPDTFIDGFLIDWSFIDDSFIHVEAADNQRTDWYFEYYCPMSSKKSIFLGEIIGIRADRNPARIQGDLYIYRIMGYKEHPNSVGLNGRGAEAFGVDMDITLSGDKAEGTLRIRNEHWLDWDISSYYWTLEELSGEEHTYHSYSMEWE